MTDDRMALLELIEKRPTADLVREMLGLPPSGMMDAEMQVATGRPWGASPGPADHRNGYRSRPWDTRVGRVELEIPKPEEGQLLPSVPGAPAHRGEGVDRGDPGGLHPRHLDPLGRHPGQGDGRLGHLQEPGQPPDYRDRRAG